MAEGEQEGYTPEQLEAEKSRTISDAELIEGGAYWDQDGDQKILILKPDQIESIHADFDKAEWEGVQEELNDFLARSDSRSEGKFTEKINIATIIDRLNKIEIDNTELVEQGHHLYYYELAKRTDTERYRARPKLIQRILFHPGKIGGEFIDPDKHHLINPGPGIIFEQTSSWFDENNKYYVDRYSSYYPTQGDYKDLWKENPYKFEFMFHTKAHISGDDLEELGWERKKEE